MYQEYYRVWSQHREQYGPKVALLYQVGGFFEIYDTENLTTGQTQANIREIAELCQLSLSVKSAGGNTQTLFGGFPEHSLAKFERTLVQAGYTVVVVVQKKGKKGDVIDRIVDHISSPGCYVDTLSVKERRLIGCVAESITDGPAALRRVYWAVVALDIATGRIWFVEGADRDRLHQFLCIHPPSELILWSDGLPAANALTDSLKQVCDVVHLRCLPVSSVALEEAALEKRWPNCRKRLDWMATQPQARRSLSYLMTFAADHVPSSLQNIHLPIPWIPDGEVRLGNAALEQLGLLSLKSGGSGGGCLLDMMDQCRSMAGKRLLRSRLMRPISNTQEIRRRLDAIDQAAGITDPTMTANTERGLRSLYDISRLFRRLELGTANLNDVACLLRSYEAVRNLRIVWNQAVPAFLDGISTQWDIRTLTDLVRDGPNSIPVRFLPFVAGSLSTVEASFAKGLTIRQEADQLCQSWSSLGKGEPLYLDDAEGGGFRVTGTKRRIASVQIALKDKGVQATTYKTSAILTSATLDTISTRHRAWFAEWTAIWSDTWNTVCAELVERGRDTTAEMEQWCADLDVTWTVAKLQQEWCWNRPEIVDAEESFLEVTKLRHPILERIQTQNPYVSHSVAFGVEGEVRQPDIVCTSRGLLLYGMNASGKSSLMKAIGLCILLAQAGFPVPAATCRVSPFTAVFTRILGNDNLWAGLSSFAVEMTEFREILRFADHRSLVLGDELCSGTESLSATALVAAGVETLTQRGAKFVFATHLHELATLPDIVSLSGVKAFHLKVHYDAANDRLIYDRSLAPGSGSALYGLEVCRALDLPMGYLERATVLRQQLAGWQGPKISSYSSAAVMETCAICNATGIAARLEMHHIRPQAEAATAQKEGFDIHAASNLVCLCATCHDYHHAGILQIQGWQDTSSGTILRWSRKEEEEEEKEEEKKEIKTQTQEASKGEIHAWVRDQHRQKIRIATIQRMAIQIFGIELSEKEIRAINLKRFQHSSP
jgi:DNA mismatch repair protein MutS